MPKAQTLPQEALVANLVPSSKARNPDRSVRTLRSSRDARNAPIVANLAPIVVRPRMARDLSELAVLSRHRS